MFYKRGRKGNYDIFPKKVTIKENDPALWNIQKKKNQPQSMYYVEVEEYVLRRSSMYENLTSF